MKRTIDDRGASALAALRAAIEREHHPQERTLSSIVEAMDAQVSGSGEPDTVCLHLLAQAMGSLIVGRAPGAELNAIGAELNVIGQALAKLMLLYPPPQHWRSSPRRMLPQPFPIVCREETGGVSYHWGPQQHLPEHRGWGRP